MTTWTPDELDRIGDAEEIEIASQRADGSLAPYVIIWVVRSGDDLYVRSAHGRGNPWFKHALASGLGRLRVGGEERDVALNEPDVDLAAELHAVYHSKYDRFGAAVVDPVVSAESERATLRLAPR